MGKPKWGPSPKRRRFVQEYLKDLNGARAARRAGYSVHTAREQATRLLSNVHVQEAISQAMAERSARTEITIDRVLEEIARLAFSDLRTLFDEQGQLRPLHTLDDDSAAMIASVEVLSQGSKVDAEGNVHSQSLTKVKVWDKTANLTLLARHLKLLTDKTEHSSDPEKPLIVSIRRAH